jgi:hypothetical protein
MRHVRREESMSDIIAGMDGYTLFLWLLRAMFGLVILGYVACMVTHVAKEIRAILDYHRSLDKDDESGEDN